MKHSLLLCLVFFAASAPMRPALADGAEADASLPSDGRIKLLHYDANDIYTVVTRVGYQSHIEFAEREEVDTISVGDRSFWQIIPSGNRLFVRPLQDDVSTNMTVITNKRSYQFDLKSVSDPDKGILYVARFTYPEEARPPAVQDPFFPPQPPVMAAPAGAQTPYPAPYLAPKAVVEPLPAPAPPPETPKTRWAGPGTLSAPSPAATPEPAAVVLTPALEPAPLPEPAKLQAAAEAPGRNRNYLYTFAGPDSGAPYEVFDNGASTFILYKIPPASAPLISIVDAHGAERPVTVYQKDGYIVVDTVTAELVLRTGRETVYVFNEMLSKHP